MHSTAAARTQELVLALSQTNHRDTLTLRQETPPTPTRRRPIDLHPQVLAVGSLATQAIADMGTTLPHRDLRL
jgi:hypothetical protein